jgi:DNA replication protein DnaC
MLNNATIERLHDMKLSVMATSFKNQLSDRAFDDVSFEERLGFLVDSEWTARKNNRLNLLIRKADYVFPDASLEDIEYHSDRQLDKALIMRLGTCNYIEEKLNVIILGATGTGKTYIANALGMIASRNFYTVKYIRLPELLGELAIARADGNYRKVIKQYKQYKLLILDEWLLYPLKEAEARDLLEIAECRYKRASTIFCSQFELGGWHKKIGDTTLADAICDRIVHNAYTVNVKGNSMRKRKGIDKENTGLRP